MRHPSNFSEKQKLLTAGGSVSQALLEQTVAFLNSDGGHVTFDTHGTTDSSTVRNALCSAIRPNPAQFVRVDTMPGGKMDVNIAPGPRTPYYLGAQGICPHGVFVQRGGRAVSAGALEILRLNREAHGDSFEDLRSLRQDLTFQEARAVAAQRGVYMAPDELTEFGICNPEDYEYSNLAFILSDQCPHALRVALFRDRKSAESRGGRHIGGSLLRQIDLGLKYVGTLETRSAQPDMDPMMATSTEGRELQFPEGALQKALLHAVAHRDYSIIGSMFVDIYDTGVEFFTPGGLLQDLTLKESLRSTDKAVRNPKLIRILQKLQFLGGSIPHVSDILPLYAGASEQPVMNVMQYSFSLYLPTLGHDKNIEVGLSGDESSGR